MVTRNKPFGHLHPCMPMCWLLWLAPVKGLLPKAFYILRPLNVAMDELSQRGPHPHGWIAGPRFVFALQWQSLIFYENAKNLLCPLSSVKQGLATSSTISLPWTYCQGLLSHNWYSLLAVWWLALLSLIKKKLFSTQKGLISTRAFLFWVCMFFLCRHKFSPGTPLPPTVQAHAR